MKVHTLVVGAFEVNCYVVEGARNEAVVIDPGADADRVRELLEAEGLRVSAYLLTHGHIDHLSALPALHAAHPAPVALHAADAAWAFKASNALPPFYTALSDAPPVTIDLAAETELLLAGLALRVLPTPGHTPGGVCLLAPDENALFTGDTLFAGSVGRTDLPGGNGRTLTASLRHLAGLDETLCVYPGHGPATSIGREKATNMFMQRLR